MKCKHYKGDGYTYNLENKQEVNLCRFCEMYLLGEMLKQKVIEDKEQVTVNVDFEKEIEKLQDRMDTLDGKTK